MVVAPAHADSGNTNNSNNPPSISCGLWAGASLDINNLYPCYGNNAAQSANNTQPANPQPTNPGNPGQAYTYAALGDSVAAGLGLPLANNASSEDMRCGRSPYGYPNLVASALNVPLHNLSCSGATAGDLFTQQHISGPNPAAQLSQAFAGGTPQLITITAGANDAHWADFLRACYARNCTTNAYTLAANAYLVALQVKMAYALHDVASLSGSGNPPQVIITGYYNPLSPNCASGQSNITSSELTWLSAETNALNQTLERTASGFSFARFVPVDFSGHELCSQQPWVQGLTNAAPFHPTAEGQQMIANDVLSAMGQ